MRVLLIMIAALMALLASACGAAAPTPTTAPVSTPTAAPTQTTAPPDMAIVKAGGGTVSLQSVEIADTPELRGVGLSGRTTLAENAGMLFVFQGDTTTGFWMRNTHVPLSIAFIGADGRIVDVKDMQPLSEQVHYSARPYRFALEVNQGFFTRRGVSAGDRVQVGERLRARAPGL